MQQTPFYAYYSARILESLPQEDSLVSVFASSMIEIYPFQIAAATFALRSPYLKGVVLCDEAGMGKSHEAMLIITKKWLQGNFDLNGQSHIVFMIMLFMTVLLLNVLLL